VAAPPAVEFSEKERAIILQMSPLPPVPLNPTNALADDRRAARLGQFLFFDRRLSANGQVACATCHDPSKAFTDARPLGQGLAPTERHTSGLWNVGYNRWYFWDGRADSLWAQALRPMETAAELGLSRLQIAHLVCSDQELKNAYEALFGPMPDLSAKDRFPAAGRPVANAPTDPHHQAWTGMRAADQDAVNRAFVNIGKCLEAYERLIISRDSSFDAFVQGLRNNDAPAVNRYPAPAQRGLKLFIGRGNCRLCHSGPNFADGEFHDTRLPTRDGGPPRDPGRYRGAEEAIRDPFNATGPYSDQREGRSADKLEFLANTPQNWGLFKTPTLRNVAITAPYMHHGQLATLRDVVVHYSTMPNVDSHHPERILIRLNLTDAEVDDLVTFLESLTGAPLDPALTRQPPSPSLSPG
jgi:cytochrome c peroxidase